MICLKKTLLLLFLLAILFCRRMENWNSMRRSVLSETELCPIPNHEGYDFAGRPVRGRLMHWRGYTGPTARRVLLLPVIPVVGQVPAVFKSRWNAKRRHGFLCRIPLLAIKCWIRRASFSFRERSRFGVPHHLLDRYPYRYRPQRNFEPRGGTLRKSNSQNNIQIWFWLCICTAMVKWSGWLYYWADNRWQDHWWMVVKAE